jgi:hypothetical protein
MKKKERIDLKLEQEFERFQTQVIAGNFAKAKVTSENVLLLRKAVIKKEPRIKSWQVHIGILALCAVLIFVGFRMKINKVNFKGEFLVNGLQMQLRGPWQLDQTLPMRKFTMTNIAKYVALGIGLQNSNIGHYDVSVDGKKENLFLNDIRFSAGSWIALRSDTNALEILIKHDSLNATVNACSGASITVRRDTNFQVENRHDNYELLMLSTIRAGEVPLGIKLNELPPWNFKNFALGGISFSEEKLLVDDSQSSESSIEAASITIGETGQKIELQSGDVIEFDALTTRRMRIASNGKLMKVMVEGEANEISAGLRGFEQKLKPNFAEYLYHNDTVLFLYASLSFIAVLLLNFKNLVMPKSD